MYLNDDDEKRLKGIADAIPVLSEAMIVSAILSAGLKACSENGSRLPLPLNFKFTTGTEEFGRHEPTPMKPRK